ncbi:MAG: DUF5132 domain-containing protein [Spirulinaceae cyanobacterium]
MLERYNQQINESALAPVRRFYNQSPTRALLLGVGAVVLAPSVLPILKPVTKAAIKTGVVFYEKTKGAIAESGEVLGDMVAEAKAEIAAEQKDS